MSKMYSLVHIFKVGVQELTDIATKTFREMKIKSSKRKTKKIEEASSADELTGNSSTDAETTQLSSRLQTPSFPMTGKRPLQPIHRRKFTPNSYFSNTLRDVVAGQDQVVVLIPNPQTEIQLRKRMFKLFKDKNITDTKEYEHSLKQLISMEATIVDAPFVKGLGKRYIYLKEERAT